MKVVRVRAEEGPRYAIVEGDELAVLKGDPLTGDWTPTGERRLYDPSSLLVPVERISKIAAIGKNYLDHVQEMGADEPPPEMQIFIKPNTTVIGTGDTIVRPQLSERVEFEGELAVVIGTEAKNISAADAAKYIFGYTVANDVTARDLQIADVQWTRGKGFDTFCPIGPLIETQFDPENSRIETRLNGEVRQSSDMSLLIHKVPEIIEFISAAFTLLPGDVVLTGTPAGVGMIAHGDTVTVEISGIGALTNPVR